MTAPTMPPLPEDTLRGADLQDAIRILESQERRKIDLVAPRSALRYEGGNVKLATIDPQILDDGVLDVNGLYRPTRTAEAQLSQLLDIPLRYMNKMRYEDNIPLLDTNVNSWTERSPEGSKVLIRALWGSDPVSPGSSGQVRAILSSRYGIRDNLDVVLACLDGMREAGLTADNIRGVDLTGDNLWFRVEAPELMVHADKWLEGYRSPFAGSGHGGASAEHPTAVHAGLVVRNSETGKGKVSVTPELRVRICDNGAMITKDAMSKIHLGASLDEGQIVWSERTHNAAVELMKRQMVDAVRSFMSVDYVQRTVAWLEEKSSTELDKPTETIEVVAKKLAYSEAEKNSILADFIRGGQITAGGVMQAVTATAQREDIVDDIERANDLISTGVAAMEFAHEFALTGRIG